MVIQDSKPSDDNTPESEHSKDIASEVIAFQKDKTLDELNDIVSNILDLARQGDKKLDAAYDKLSKYIFDRFGMKVTVERDSQKLAAISIPRVVCMPVMSGFLLKTEHQGSHLGYTKSVLDKLKPNPRLKGTIDLKRAKVSGFYSTIEFNLQVAFKGFAEYNFDSREVTEIIAHELGHAFFSLEFMFRTLRASQVLSAAHRARTDNVTDEGLVYEDVIDMCAERLAKEGLIEKTTDFITASKVENETVMQEIVYSLVWQQMAVDYGTERSKVPNFENLADQFVTRLGGGEHLVNGLMVLGLIDEVVKGNSQQILDLVTTSILGLSIIGIPLLLGSILYAGKPLHNGVGYIDIYDKPHARMMRIRRGIVENLKLSTHTPGERMLLLQQIESIDLSIKGYNDFESIASRIHNYIFKEKRDTAAALKLERDLEDLVNNNLFTAATKLQRHI